MFIPQSIIAQGDDAVRRARVIVIFWLALLPWPLLFSGIYLFWIEAPLPAAACFISWLAMPLTPIVLLRTGRVLWAGNLAAFDMFCVFTALTLTTGGLHASACAWTAAMSLGAICMAGRRSATVWTGLLLVEIAVLWFLTKEGYLPKSAIPENRRLLLNAMSLTAFLLAIFSMGLVYEAQKNWALGLVLGREKALAEALSRAELAAAALERANTQLQHHISERQQAEAALLESERQLREAKEVAEASSRIKSEFLANMSHEIRTPMTAILGYLELINDNCEQTCPLDRRPLQEPMSIIRRNGEHLMQIINDILDLSKIEAGKMQIEMVRSSVPQLLSEVALFARGCVARKGLRFSVENDGPIPQAILTDPTRLRQILMNLVGNAVKFTDAGRVRLVIKLATPELPAFESGASSRTEPRLPPEGLLQFDVIDTGIGMTSEQTSRLFQPFSQLNSSTSRQHGGTGLGLAISRKLADRLGGTITVQSNPGAGSCFRVAVPTGSLQDVPVISTITAETLQAAAADTPDIVRNLNCRILLAEDGPDNQRLISTILTRAGAGVTVVDNGRSAVEVALAESKSGSPFDVVLMDMQMPEMDGYTACAMLRAQAYTGPIIALTAHAMAADREKCMEAGCNDYASKPVDRSSLMALINTYTCPNRQGPAPLSESA